jgi:hypothetical protein
MDTVWEVAAEHEANKKRELAAAKKDPKLQISPEMRLAEEIQARKNQLRKEVPLVPGGSL